MGDGQVPATIPYDGQMAATLGLRATERPSVRSSRCTSHVAEARRVASWSLASPPGRRLRIGIVGCGDVAHRRYLPALESAQDRVEVVALCDPKPGAAELAAQRVGHWSPAAAAFADLGRMLDMRPLDAAFNLTPAPFHAEVSQRCLDTGVHVYSEKPLADSLTDADRLIETATRNRLLLLCAPATAATRRIAWVREIVASGRFGPLTLIVGQYPDPGPASWREYTGDPAPFYGPEIGPLRDHGVYRLHAMTAVLGPVRRVQAMGAIGVPERRVRAGPLVGTRIMVTSPDHILVNLEFANGALGQLLSSYGALATRAPWLEFHFATATLSFDGDQYDPNSTASLYLDDESPLALEGWMHEVALPPPGEPLPVVETGVAHFIACLRGEASPILTAEHARHVLDIILKTYRSIEDGASHPTETGF
jgi:predicted dehydrogenase